MKAFAWVVCYPCRWCCPCADTATTKTKVSGKTDKTVKTGKTGNTLKTDRTPQTEKKSPKSPTKRETKRRTKTGRNLVKTTKTQPKALKDFKRKSLTKEYRIGESPGDYISREAVLKMKGLTLGEEIGRGSYATVYKMTDNRTGTIMACKAIRLTKEENSEQFESLKSELYIMINAKPNQHIIRVLDHFLLSDKRNLTDFCYIIMEFANGGNILDRMKIIENNETKYKRLDEKKAKDYFKQTVYGLQYLHSVLETAHKDLKLANILVCIQNDNSEVIKITDFGLSRISYDPKEGVIKNNKWVGTVDYMSPQIYRIYACDKHGIKLEKLKEYNPFAADCWALGVCLYVMITARNPFNTNIMSSDQINEVYQSMKQQKYEISQNTRCIYSNDCLELIKALLEPKVDIRLSVKHILTHPWFKE